jgi:hypothetical protein
LGAALSVSRAAAKRCPSEIDGFFNAATDVDLVAEGLPAGVDNVLVTIRIFSGPLELDE